MNKERKSNLLFLSAANSSSRCGPDIDFDHQCPNEISIFPNLKKNWKVARKYPPQPGSTAVQQIPAALRFRERANTRKGPSVTPYWNDN
jgi:hypothetical protein